MKVKSLIAAFILSILVLTFVVRTDDPLESDIDFPSIPDDPDAFVVDNESRFADIRPGTEKKIIWYDPAHKNKAKYAIIYLHGFSASRQETAPLCELVAQQLRANLFYTRLSGHGRSSEAMAEATVQAWLEDVVEALAIGRCLGEQVIVIGASTGGTLATWLAHQYKDDDIAALVLLSPHFGPKQVRAKALNWPGAELFVPIIFGKEHSWSPYNVEQAKYWTTSYPTASLFTMMSLVRYVKRLNFYSIDVPTLFIYSRDDQVVDAEITDDVYERFQPSKRDKIAVSGGGDPSHHMLAGDILSPENTHPLADEIVRKLNRMLP